MKMIRGLGSNRAEDSEINIADICRETQLPAALNRVGEPDFLDDYVLAIANYLAGNRDLRKESVDCSVSSEQLPLVKQVVDYALDLANLYGETVYDLFLTTLDATVPFAIKERFDYLGKFNDMVDEDFKSSNPIFNGFVLDILARRIQYYDGEFGAEDAVYSEVLGGLRADLGKFFEAVEPRLKLNSKSEYEAGDLDYGTLFENDSLNGTLTESIVSQAIDSGKVSPLVLKYGVRCVVPGGVMENLEIWTLLFIMVLVMTAVRLNRFPLVILFWIESRL